MLEMDPVHAKQGINILGYSILLKFPILQRVYIINDDVEDLNHPRRGNFLESYNVKPSLTLGSGDKFMKPETKKFKPKQDSDTIKSGDGNDSDDFGKIPILNTSSDIIPATHTISAEPKSAIRTTSKKPIELSVIDDIIKYKSLAIPKNPTKKYIPYPNGLDANSLPTGIHIEIASKAFPWECVELIYKGRLCKPESVSFNLFPNIPEWLYDMEFEIISEMSLPLETFKKYPSIEIAEMISDVSNYLLIRDSLEIQDDEVFDSGIYSIIIDYENLNWKEPESDDDSDSRYEESERSEESERYEEPVRSEESERYEEHVRSNESERSNEYERLNEPENISNSNKLIESNRILKSEGHNVPSIPDNSNTSDNENIQTIELNKISESNNDNSNILEDSNNSNDENHQIINTSNINNINSTNNDTNTVTSNTLDIPYGELVVNNTLRAGYLLSAIRNLYPSDESDQTKYPNIPTPNTYKIFKPYTDKTRILVDLGKYPNLYSFMEDKQNISNIILLLPNSADYFVAQTLSKDFKLVCILGKVFCKDPKQVLGNPYLKEDKYELELLKYGITLFSISKVILDTEFEELSSKGIPNFVEAANSCIYTYNVRIRQLTSSIDKRDC